MRRQILSIAIPAIVSNLTTPLLSLADAAVIGHLGSEVFIAAIAVAGTVFSTIYWLFAFLRMGTSGMTAQSYGAKDEEELSINFYRPLILAILIGLFLIIARNVWGETMLTFIAEDDAATPLAREYFGIHIFGAPATLGLYVVNGFLVGVQNTRSAMWLSILINVVNILATIVFVFALKLSIAGAAWGTLLAQWGGFVVGAIYIVRTHGFKIPYYKKLFELKSFKRFFAINFYIFLRTLCLVSVTLWFTRQGASISVMTLAVNSLLMQFFILFSYFMDGYAYAAEALVGECVGRRDSRVLWQVVVQIIKIGGFTALFFSFVYFIFGTDVLTLLTSDQQVVECSKEYIVWASLIPLVSFAAFLADGIFVGATITRNLLITMMCAAIVFFAVVVVSQSTNANHWLWLAFISYLATRSLISMLLLRKMRFKN